MHLAKLAWGSVERGRSEDLKALSKRSQAREKDLSSFWTIMILLGVFCNTDSIYYFDRCILPSWPETV